MIQCHGEIGDNRATALTIKRFYCFLFQQTPEKLVIMRPAICLPVLLCALAFSRASAQTDSSDIRQQRKWAISAEIGMNSLSSLVGPVGTY